MYVSFQSIHIECPAFEMQELDKLPLNFLTDPPACFPILCLQYPYDDSLTNNFCIVLNFIYFSQAFFVPRLFEGSGREKKESKCKSRASRF